MSLWLAGGIEAFIDEVLSCSPMIRSIWLVADTPGGRRDAPPNYTWDLIALADTLTLYRLRKTVKLHRSDVRFRVLGEDRRLEAAWGSDGPLGVRVASDWEPASAREGYYTESPGSKRRKATCIWQGIDAIKGPGS